MSGKTKERTDHLLQKGLGKLKKMKGQTRAGRTPKKKEKLRWREKIIGPGKGSNHRGMLNHILFQIERVNVLSIGSRKDHSDITAGETGGAWERK